MSANANFDSLAAITLNKVRPMIMDNISDNQALIFQLKERNLVEYKSGGLKLVEPIELSKNDTFSSYSGADELLLRQQDPFSAAEFNWKQFATTVQVVGIDVFKNSGAQEQKVNYLKSLVKNANKSMKLGMSAQLFADGSGNGGKDLTGLAAAVENGSSWSTYANINSAGSTAAEQRWRNAWIGSIGSFAANGRRQITTLINNTAKEGEYPTLSITTQAISEAFEATLVVNERYNMDNAKDEALGKAGFRHYMFRGVPMLWDSDCTSGAWYVLNANNLKLVVGKDYDEGDMIQPDNQDVKSMMILLYAQLTTNARNRQGVGDGITTP